MKRIALTLMASSVLLGLCTVTMAQDSAPVAPNNSAVNVRDRAPGAMTAGEQSNAKSDVALTRKIRRAVVKDHSLSTMQIDQTAQMRLRLGEQPGASREPCISLAPIDRSVHRIRTRNLPDGV